MEFSKEQALLAIDRERVPICTASDQVWENPETAFQEFKSVDILCELLEKEGFHVERNLAGIATAFSGTYGHGKPVVGILGEFDALSGLSQKCGVPQREERIPGGSGHGCGHNIIASATVGAAPDRLIAKYMRFSPVKGQ